MSHRIHNPRLGCGPLTYLAVPQQVGVDWFPSTETNQKLIKFNSAPWPFMVPLPLDPLASCPDSVESLKMPTNTGHGSVPLLEFAAKPLRIMNKQFRRSTKTCDHSDGNREYRVLMTTGWASPKIQRHGELKVFKTMLQQFAHGLVTPSRLEDCATPVWPASQSYLQQAQVYWGLLGCPWIPPQWGPYIRVHAEDAPMALGLSKVLFVERCLHNSSQRLCMCTWNVFQVFVLVFVFVLQRICVCECLRTLFSGNCNCWPRQHRRTFQYLRSNHSLEHPESKLKNSAHIRTWSVGQTSNHGPWTESGIFSGGCSITCNASHVLRELSLWNRDVAFASLDVALWQPSWGDVQGGAMYVQRSFSKTIQSTQRCAGHFALLFLVASDLSFLMDLAFKIFIQYLQRSKYSLKDHCEDLHHPAFPNVLDVFFPTELCQSKSETAATIEIFVPLRSLLCKVNHTFKLNMSDDMT